MRRYVTGTAITIDRGRGKPRQRGLRTIFELIQGGDCFSNLQLVIFRLGSKFLSVATILLTDAAAVTRDVHEILG